MSRNKSKNTYGTFVTKKPWYRCRKCAIGSSLILFAVVSAGFVGYKAFKNKPVEQVLQIPTATASEMPGWWYQQYFGKEVCEEERCRLTADPDNDKLNNAQEFYYHSNPLDPDTNRNGLTDGEDVAQNFDPSKPGKVTFEEAASDDSIVGESLLFGEDVKKIINEMVDPNRVALPLVNELELNVTDKNSKEDLIQYFASVQIAADKYFTGEVEASIEQAITLGNHDELKLKTLMLLSDLKKIPVPSNALTLHRYYVSMITLIPLVLQVADPTVESAEMSRLDDIWFSNTQAFLVMTQKAYLEKIRLINLMK